MSAPVAVERPVVYRKHCPLFMTTVTHFSPRDVYRVPVDTEKLLTGCAGKRMEVSKRPVFMDIQNVKTKTTTATSVVVTPKTTVVKPLVVVRKSDVATPAGTPSTGRKPGPGNKTGLTTYQEEICHIKKSTSCFQSR